MLQRQSFACWEVLARLRAVRLALIRARVAYVTHRDTTVTFTVTGSTRVRRTLCAKDYIAQPRLAHFWALVLVVQRPD